jgi:putative FmdB family regulatory protein
MPIYAYRCEHCGHAQDVLQKVSDPLLTVCPACGQAAYRKQVTAAGFQLKGSGWYVTDFRDSGKKPAGKTGADKAADSGTQATNGQPEATNGGSGSKQDTDGPKAPSTARADQAGSSTSTESAASSSAPPSASPAAS